MGHRLKNPLWLLALIVACEKQPAEIRVKGPLHALESVKMIPEFPPFEKKRETLALRASAFDARGAFRGPARVRWDSTNRAVATVDQAGLVTILSSGETKIQAVTDGYSKTLADSLLIRAQIIGKIRILPPQGEKKIHLGEKRQLEAEVRDDRGQPLDGAKVRWRSSGYAATVSEIGEVEGRALGTVQITAESGGASDRLDVEVLDWLKGQRAARRGKRLGKKQR